MVVWIFYVPLPSKSIIILKPLKTMKQRRLVLYVEDFRLIPNPRIDEEHGMILGRHGQDAEIWRFDGMSKIEKVSVKQGYY